MRLLLLLSTAMIGFAQHAPALDCSPKSTHDPSDPSSIYRYAVCLQASNSAEAVNTYRKAIALNFQPATAQAQIASVFFVTGQRERALIELRRTATQDCTHTSFRQMDFTIGDWDVFEGGERLARSVVQPILNGCVLLDTWTDLTGVFQWTIAFFDPVTGTWRQARKADQERGSDREGTFTGTTMTLENSQRTARRRIIRVDLNNFHERDETSTDSGHTWKLARELVYRRLAVDARLDILSPQFLLGAEAGGMRR